jgi:crotonobetaine/carnitine-CoA ligase
VISPGTVHGFLRGLATTRPDVPFLKVGSEPWLTYAELDAAVDRVAGGLHALGVQKGDRVAVVCDNRLEAIELMLACGRIGAIEVPFNYYLRGEYLRSQFDGAGAAVLVADAAGVTTTAPLLDGANIRTTVHLDDIPHEATGVAYGDLEGEVPLDVDVLPDDILSIVYTSGTTGMPKGCMLSHGYYLMAGGAAGAAEFVVPGDRMFTAFPHFHVSFQINAFTSALVNGASFVWECQFRASRFMKRAGEEEVTMIWGVPAMAVAILAQEPTPADRLPSLRLACFAPMHADRQIEFEKRFGGIVCCEAYGQSEAVPITMTSPNDPLRSRSTLGRPSTLYELRIVDEHDEELPVGEVGEVVVRPHGPHSMFSGYWRNPEATAAMWRNLWHHTGDLGWVDDEGRLTFVDRAKDAIRRRGENVSCFQLEQTIGLHPAVAHVAACAVPSPLGEDDIKVSIVRAGQEAVDEETLLRDLFSHFREQLPYFAIPRFIEFRSEFPLTATGRVRKDALRAEGIHDGVHDLESLGLTVPRDERRG